MRSTCLTNLTLIIFFENSKSWSSLVCIFPLFFYLSWRCYTCNSVQQRKAQDTIPQLILKKIILFVLLVFWRNWWKFMYYVEFSKRFLAVGIVSKWNRHRGVFCSFETWSCPDVRKIKVLRPDLQSCEITPLRVAIATNFLALALTTPFHRVLRVYKGRSLCQNMHLVLRLYKECTAAEEFNIVGVREENYIW